MRQHRDRDMRVAGGDQRLRQVVYGVAVWIEPAAIRPGHRDNDAARAAEPRPGRERASDPGERPAKSS